MADITDALIQALVRRGVKTVYGVPGDFVLRRGCDEGVFDGMYRYIHSMEYEVLSYGTATASLFNL